jgi:transcriptional regulator with XRE-family HTH domain
MWQGARVTGDQSGAPVPSVLKDRIERLFEITRPAASPNRRWRNSEVVAACRSQGYDLSESHLSELRRGVKSNPTMKTLNALAWFFGVRVGYFVDEWVGAETEDELLKRERDLAAALSEAREIESLEREAARDLQRALRESGVTKVAHRGSAGSTRERAKMMQALAKALSDESDDETTR